MASLSCSMTAAPTQLREARRKSIQIRLVCLLLFLFTLSGRTATLDELYKDLQAAAGTTLSQEQFITLTNQYRPLLLPPTAFERKSPMTERFPTAPFKQKKDYPELLKKLLSSNNDINNALGYLLLAASSDRSENSLLVKKLDSTPAPFIASIVAYSALVLEIPEMDALFEYFIRYEELNDSPMLERYIALFGDALQPVALNYLDVKDPKVPELALMIMAKMSPNETIKKAVLERMTTFRDAQKAQAF